MSTEEMSRADDVAGSQVHGQRGLRQCILVVEEACDLRQLNAEVLMDVGYQVDVTEDVATAWAALQLYRYDLLVTDQFLAEEAAVELIMKIDAAKMAVPVLMVAKSLPDWNPTPHSCLQAVTMLHKPYTIEKLLGSVKNVLSGNAVVCGNAASLPSRPSQQAATSLRR